MRLAAKWRVSALALAALWVAVPAIAAVHGAVESHSYCAEHQAIEHGSSAPHLGSASSAAVSIGSRAPGEGDAHEACALADFIPTSALDTADQVAVADAQLASHAEAAATPTSHRPLAILITAPKSSPPA